MANLGPVLIFGDTSRGVINGVSHRLAPQNSVAHAVNFDFDHVLGESVTRKGSTLIGSGRISGGSSAVRGLYQFVDSAGGAYSQLLAAAANGSIYNLVGSTWTVTDVTGWDTSAKVEFETFLDAVVATNGVNSPRSWAGTGSWLSSGGPLDIGNMPVGKFVKVYKDQVVVAGISGRPDDLDISSVPNAGGTAISWTSGNRRIRVNPEDSSNITALGEIGGLLVVFKDHAMYRWNNRNLEPDLIIEVGCLSQKSVAVGGSMMFFFNENGFWVTRGEYPVLISRPVQPWIDAIDPSYYDDVSSFCDGTHLYASIGDVTVEGVAYANAVLRYSLAAQSWAVRTYANEFRVLATRTVSGDVQLIGGDDTGYVLQLESTSLTDNGTAINYDIISHPQDFGSRALRKSLAGKAYAFGQNPVDALVMVKSGTGDWKTLGSMKSDVNEFDLRNTDVNVKGNYFSFRVTGTHSTARFSLQGLEIPNVEAVAHGKD